MQAMDIYYHLLTAWGFIQSGGYSGWDFWQYAPLGRIHIYPPFLHLIFAGFIKLGANQIILAKSCEVLIPCVFLAVLWNFIKVNYGQRFAFFVVLVFFSSFSFYLFLANHLPATLAFIFGILSLEQLFRKQLLRSSILLGLCFYTHIGSSWFFIAAFILYGIFNKQARGKALFVSAAAFLLALPMIIKELNGLKYINTLGLELNERYLIQVKAVDLVFAAFGLALALKRRQGHALFLAFFIAGFIFLSYPYRYFCAEGYFPVIILCALFLDRLYQAAGRKSVILMIAVFTLVISPTWQLYKDIADKRVSYKINIFDSALINLLLAKGRVLWFPKEYVSTARIVKENSGERDIVFSSLNFIGLTVASLSGRASANALLPEMKLPQNYNPLTSSKIIIFSQTDDPLATNKIINALKLIKAGENDFFVVYKNSGCNVSAGIRKSVLPFSLIWVIGLLVLLAFWQADRFDKWGQRLFCKKAAVPNNRDWSIDPYPPELKKKYKY